LGRFLSDTKKSSKMFDETITKTTKNILALLGKKKILPKGTYLAGGTALALQLGHRRSFDLDFFTDKPFKRREIIQKLGPLNFKLEQEAWRTILGKFTGIKFSLFYYKYPQIFPYKKFLKINLADLPDIAAMKIDAISSRGKKRDFFDLYFLMKEFSLEEMLDFYNQKYKALATNRTHVLRSLEYFADADKDDNPEMIKESPPWEEIKGFFKREVIRIAKEEF